MIDNTLCACGCGEVFYPFDERGRPRKFLLGHSARVHKYNLISAYIAPAEKQCTTCFLVKPIDQFYYKTYTSKTTGEKYKRYRVECIECSKKHTTNYIQDNYDMVYAKKKKVRIDRKDDIRFHVQEKISTWRKASCVQSDLTVDYLVNLYNQQNCRCYYTNKEMVFGWVNGKVHHTSLSLDKLDPSKGYVQGNVVWCTYLTNTMKQDLNEQQFYEAISLILTNKENDMNDNLSIADDLKSITRKSILGDLPHLIRQLCLEEANNGKSFKRLYFHEPPQGVRPFYGSLGPAGQKTWEDINKPFNRQSSLTEEEYLLQILDLLRGETGLNITLQVPPHFDPRYAIEGQNTISLYGHDSLIYPSVILDISW